MILLSNSTISFVFNNEVIFFFKSMKLFANEKFSIKKFKTKIIKKLSITLILQRVLKITIDYLMDI